MRNCFKNLVRVGEEWSLLKLAFCFPPCSENGVLYFYFVFCPTWHVSQNPNHSICYIKLTGSLLCPDTNVLFHLIYYHIINYIHFKTSMERIGNTKIDGLIQLSLQGSGSQTSMHIKSLANLIKSYSSRMHSPEIQI